MTCYRGMVLVVVVMTVVMLGFSPNAIAQTPTPTPTGAQVLYVKPTGDDQTGDGRSWGTALASIQQALDMAEAGDEVWVAAGVYPESLQVDRAVALYGSFVGTEQTRMERELEFGSTVVAPSAASRCVTVSNTTEWVLEGFTLTGGVALGEQEAGWGGGILFGENTGGLVRSCRIVKNQARNGGGVFLGRGAYPHFENCLLAHNQALVGTEVDSWPPGEVESNSITINLPGLAAGARPLRMVRLPSGSFLMGSPESERSRSSAEGPVHTVNIGYEIYMGETEVTQAQYRAVMGTNPARDWGVGNDHPVYSVSWNAAKAFVAELNKLGQGTFRLPSEAEWEYACCAGTQTRFYFGDSLGCDDHSSEDCAAGVLPGNRSDYMWYVWSDGQNGYPRGTKEVAQLLPNQWGLYDMHGNVHEWCEDCWDFSYTGAPADGSAWEAGGDSTTRVIRGGDWYTAAGSCRSAYRGYGSPNTMSIEIGFRVVRDAGEPGPVPTGTPTPVNTPIPTDIPTDTPTPIPTDIPLVTIPAGSFEMGNTGSARDTEFGHSDEYPRHTVTFDHSFQIGQFEITNAQYVAVLNWVLTNRNYLAGYSGGYVSYNGQILLDVSSFDCDIDYSSGRFHFKTRNSEAMDSHPVKKVSWYGAVAFCNWLSEKEGLVSCYDLSAWDLSNAASGGYRLPSEAEWEYACRGPVSNPHRYDVFPFGDDTSLNLASCDYSAHLDDYMVWCGNDDGWTEPVGSKLAQNGWGLYDMCGNVWEWCGDWWHDDYSGAPGNGVTWLSQRDADYRVIRGGDWDDNAWGCRSANRYRSYPSDTSGLSIGFRVARTP